MTSTKTVRVTPAQKQAAKGLISRSAQTGQFVSTAVTKIVNASKANGKSSAARSAKTDRFVTTTAAKRRPTTSETT